MILHIFLIISKIIIVGLCFYPTMYPLCTHYDSLYGIGKLMPTHREVDDDT